MNDTAANTSPLYRIGQGFCGTVWSSSTDPAPCAIKREDGGPGRSLSNEYEIHTIVLQNYPVKSKAHISRCHGFYTATNQDWWDEHSSQFPRDFQVACNVLVTDRIPAFTQPIRETIIDLYCPEKLRNLIKTSVPDQDCLVRPYLGRRRQVKQSQSRFQAFSLRNYPLHLDQIEELELDAILYAEIMAETLADLYWRAHVDGNDIEFVLAPPRSDLIRFRQSQAGLDNTEQSTIITSDILGEHVVWILDFDCCRSMPANKAGVEQAVKAFYENDPFFPRPRQPLWDVFRARFIQASKDILGEASLEAQLPMLWVEMVENWQG